MMHDKIDCLRVLKDYVDEYYYNVTLPDMFHQKKWPSRDTFLYLTYRYWAATEILGFLNEEDDDSLPINSLIEIVKMISKFENRAVGKYQGTMFHIAKEVANDLLGVVIAMDS